jgi:hypothetical protein
MGQLPRAGMGPVGVRKMIIYNAKYWTGKAIMD